MAFDLLPPPVPTSTDGVRELTPDEVKSVEHVFRATGNPLPDPAISTFVGCVEDGKVVAFIVLQLKLHAQPLWIEEGRSQLLPALIRAAESVIITRTGPQWVYLFAPAGRLSQLAQHMGMQLEPWVVLSKLVTPEIPDKPVMELPEDLQSRLPLESSPEVIQ